MKEFLKRILPNKVFAFVRDLIYPEKIGILEQRLINLFINQYKELIDPKHGQKILFRNSEFKIYSKHGGDGILACIFSKIGVTNRAFVEIGVEDGRECNTTNLAFNFGWSGLLVDANDQWIKSAEQFYKEKLGSTSNKVKFHSGIVNAENINAILEKNGIAGEIDLFSLDIDGNDYWVFKSLKNINPRVLVLEYNSAFGDQSVTVKYNPDRIFSPKEHHPLYFGASLTALAKLADRKGYILVGCDTNGHDAFFIRKDEATDRFIEMSPGEAFYANPFALRVFGTIEEQYNQLKDLDIVGV